MSFKSFGFTREIMARIEAMEYTTPTPIQQQAIPAVLDGEDVMGLAQTGTGKTAAFALPILQRLLTGRRGQIRALIVAPTRELVEQINDQIESLGKGTGLRSLAVYGGVSSNPQIKALKKGVDILVACPGRLLDLYEQRVLSLSRLETLVLDEADHMFDMGFLPDIRKIIDRIPEDRQTLLFAATMPPDIRMLADKILKNPRYIKIDFDVPLDTISHALFPVEQNQKTALLLEILKDMTDGSVLIFTRTKQRARKLGEQLVNNGYNAVSLQGNLSQNRRQQALDGFRDGLFPIMVATDIAARGIDVFRISHVINYDMPDTTEAYTHRTGRTGRATRKGTAFSFVTMEDKKLVSALERNVGIDLEYQSMPGYTNATVKQPVRPSRSRPFRYGRQHNLRKSHAAAY